MSILPLMAWLPGLFRPKPAPQYQVPHRERPWNKDLIRQWGQAADAAQQLIDAGGLVASVFIERQLAYIYLNGVPPEGVVSHQGPALHQGRPDVLRYEGHIGPVIVRWTVKAEVQ